MLHHYHHNTDSLTYYIKNWSLPFRYPVAANHHRTSIVIWRIWMNEHSAVNGHTILVCLHSHCWQDDTGPPEMAMTSDNSWIMSIFMKNWAWFHYMGIDIWYKMGINDDSTLTQAGTHSHINTNLPARLAKRQCADTSFLYIPDYMLSLNIFGIDILMFCTDCNAVQWVH